MDFSCTRRRKTKEYWYLTFAGVIGGVVVSVVVAVGISSEPDPKLFVNEADSSISEEDITGGIVEDNSFEIKFNDGNSVVGVVATSSVTTDGSFEGFSTGRGVEGVILLRLRGSFGSGSAAKNKLSSHINFDIHKLSEKIYIQCILYNILALYLTLLS